MKTFLSILELEFRKFLNPFKRNTVLLTTISHLLTLYLNNIINVNN